MQTNLAQTIEISDLQQEVKAKVLEVGSRKELKNSELARILNKSESVLSELVNDKRSFTSKLLNEISSSLNDFFIQKQGLVHTRQYNYILNVTKTCKSDSDFRLLTGNTALGKSVMLREFNKNHPAVWYLKIDRPMSWKILLRKFCGVLGISTEGKNQYQLYDAIEQFFKERRSLKPLLIIDEMEMLPLTLWLRMKGLFTTLEGMVGLLMCSITQYKSKLARKAGLHPQSWMPILDDSNVYTTLARRVKVFEVPGISSEDVMNFFRVRGVKNEEVLIEASSKIWNYDQAEKTLLKAQRIGFKLDTLSVQEFSKIKIY